MLSIYCFHWRSLVADPQFFVDLDNLSSLLLLVQVLIMSWTVWFTIELASLSFHFFLPCSSWTSLPMLNQSMSTLKVRRPSSVVPNLLSSASRRSHSRSVCLLPFQDDLLLVATDISLIFWLLNQFFHQVLWICLDGLEERDIRWGPLVPHPSQQVKVWRIIIWNAWTGVAVWFLCGTKSGASPPRKRKQRRSPRPFCPPWPGAVIPEVNSFLHKRRKSRCFWFDFFWSAILTAISSVLQFASPLLVNQLIGYFSLN